MCFSPSLLHREQLSPEIFQSHHSSLIERLCSHPSLLPSSNSNVIFSEKFAHLPLGSWWLLFTVIACLLICVLHSSVNSFHSPVFSTSLCKYNDIYCSCGQMVGRKVGRNQQGKICVHERKRCMLAFKYISASKTTLYLIHILIDKLLLQQLKLFSLNKLRITSKPRIIYMFK